ncbi:fumarylacetoacetate hydrolase family protein [Microbaculum marinum]|uniref:Fumarylacetoacetate hydrolase family protein n=1 Tax=Microbaculum marinum TaxID=1764581 RepID=A0AAW9RJW5_9HYPH
MKLISYSRGTANGWGVLGDDGVVDMTGTFPSLRAALEAGGLADIAAAAGDRGADFPLDDVRLLPPVPDPGKIICIGLNYGKHLAESGAPMPEYPTLFVRVTDTLVAHDEPMVVPSVSSELDYECELALVIGKGGRHIAREDALAHVAGYACFNDGSVRDYQMKHSLAAGKNFHATGGFGPWLVTADAIPDPGRLQLRTLINGQELQNGNTSDLIFDIPEIISYISAFTPLSPGDVISTGTPEGVGFVRKPPIFLKPGDTVEIEVEGIGKLRNPVIAEPS